MKKFIPIFILFISIFCINVLAQENWVVDETNVLSEETKEYIRALNEEIFEHYRKKPKLQVMIVKNLPLFQPFNKYKSEKFKESEISKEEYGIFFFLSLQNRQYGISLGNGFSKDLILTNDLEIDFLTKKMKLELRREKYDEITMEIVKYIENRVGEDEFGLNKERQLEFFNKEATKEFFITLALIILSIALGAIIICSLFNIEEKMENI